MADQIAGQVAKPGDLDGTLWLPQVGKWDDIEAFHAFREAMTREFDLMVLTPGQDKPLAFSNELGKFAFQFKTFAFSAHHRILLAGIQKADVDVLATFGTMLTLGVLVSNIKANQKGRDQKEGLELWENAIDRSGLAGWLLAIHAPANALAGGALSLSGEELSRWRARGEFENIFGPSARLGKGAFEAISSASKQVMGTGNMSGRDIDAITRLVPGNNLWYLMRLTEEVEKRVKEAVGPR